MSMFVYALGSGLTAAAIVIYLIPGYYAAVSERHEIVYMLCVALLHVIFSIWYTKGRRLRRFNFVSGIGRILTGVYLALLWIFGLHELENFGHAIGGPTPSSLVILLSVYLPLMSCFEFITGVWTLVEIYSQKVETSDSSTDEASAKMSLEAKNRFAFGLYMIMLSLLLLINAAWVLELVRMPASIYRGVLEQEAMGPVQILGFQVLLLAIYNLVAAWNGLNAFSRSGHARGDLYLRSICNTGSFRHGASSDFTDSRCGLDQRNINRGKTSGETDPRISDRIKDFFSGLCIQSN